MTAPSRLMVLISDRLSELVRKGEVTARYYNPGNLFSEVHLVMTNDDRPDPAAVQPMVGSARLFLHNLPAGRRLFAETLGWRPWLLGRWTAAAVNLAARIRPQLVRCHGAHLNAFAARAIKRRLGIPYVVSLHINPDVNGRGHGLRGALFSRAIDGVAVRALREADLVLPVYQPIVPFLKRIGVTRYRVVYNVINPIHLLQKRDYALHSPVRVVSVGRLITEKDPECLIRAVAAMPNIELTVVGDGPCADRLRRLAATVGAGNRVMFLPAVANDRLCAMLPDFDIFAIRSDYWEISKSMLEALLTGLPAVINRRPGEPVPELSPDICLLVENTVASYRAALERLISDSALRERLGRAAFAQSRARWSPEKTEAAFVDIYRAVLAAA